MQIKEAEDKLLNIQLCISMKGFSDNLFQKEVEAHRSFDGFMSR